MVIAVASFHVWPKTRKFLVYHETLHTKKLFQPYLTESMQKYEVFFLPVVNVRMKHSTIMKVISMLYWTLQKQYSMYKKLLCDKVGKKHCLCKDLTPGQAALKLYWFFIPALTSLRRKGQKGFYRSHMVCCDQLNFGHKTLSLQYPNGNLGYNLIDQKWVFHFCVFYGFCMFWYLLPLEAEDLSLCQCQKNGRKIIVSRNNLQLSKSDQKIHLVLHILLPYPYTFFPCLSF